MLKKIVPAVLALGIVAGSVNAENEVAKLQAMGYNNAQIEAMILNADAQLSLENIAATQKEKALLAASVAFGAAAVAGGTTAVVFGLKNREMNKNADVLKGLITISKDGKSLVLDDKIAAALDLQAKLEVAEKALADNKDDAQTEELKKAAKDAGAALAKDDNASIVKAVKAFYAKKAEKKDDK